VSLQLLTKTNIPSNTYARQFEVPGEIRLLLKGETSVDAMVRSLCTDSADRMYCTGTHSNDGYCDFTTLSGTPPDTKDTGVYDYLKNNNLQNPTFWAFHSNCANDIENDKGTDTHEVSLSNGCIIYDVDVRTYKTSGKEIINPELIDDYGKSKLKATINWTVSPADAVAYWYWVWVKCPKS
jgi:hypothetical protein